MRETDGHASRFRWLASSTWALLALAVVGILGGEHPSNVQRDHELWGVAVLVGLVNAPVAAWLAIPSLRRLARWPQILRVAFMLSLRIVASAWVLALVHGVSHEGRPGLERADAPRVGSPAAPQ